MGWCGEIVNQYMVVGVKIHKPLSTEEYKLIHHLRSLSNVKMQFLLDGKNVHQYYCCCDEEKKQDKCYNCSRPWIKQINEEYVNWDEVIVFVDLNFGSTVRCGSGGDVNMHNDSSEDVESFMGRINDVKQSFQHVMNKIKFFVPIEVWILSNSYYAER